eukprot:7300165-Lingulodinium_polyedra.AAC.1
MAKGKPAKGGGSSSKATASKVVVEQPAAPDKSRHADRRDLEAKSIRAIGARYKSWTVVQMTERLNRNWKSMVDLCVE